MDSFEEILQKKHLKRTKARVMILKVLQKSLPMTAGMYMKRCGREILSSVFLRCTVIVKRWQKGTASPFDDAC